MANSRVHSDCPHKDAEHTRRDYFVFLQQHPLILSDFGYDDEAVLLISTCSRGVTLAVFWKLGDAYLRRLLYNVYNNTGDAGTTERHA